LTINDLRKGKVVLVGHEGMYGEWRYNSTHS